MPAAFRSICIGLAAAIAAATAGTSTSHACTPPPEGVFDRTVLPEDGAVEVPRNARVLVVYDSEGDVPADTLELRVQGGAAVATSTTTPRTIGRAVLLTPTTPLEASTTYELFDSLQVPCEASDPATCLGEAMVVARFTTGTTLDTTPPTLSGITVESSVYCVAGSCPDSETEQIDRISIAGHDDDGSLAWIRYEYLGLGGEILAGPTSWLITGRGCGGGAGYFSNWKYLPMPSEVRLRAVDLAGNVETTPHVIMGGSCDLVGDTCDPDAGPGGAGDDDAAGGCCSTGGDPGGAALLALVTIAGVAARKRAKR